jgi:hypothetical protein
MNEELPSDPVLLLEELQKTVNIYSSERFVDIEPRITQDYQCSIEGATISAIKHLRNLGRVSIPKEIALKILWFSRKGQSCKQRHLNPSQEESIMNFLSEHREEVTDPHLLDFVEERGGFRR